MSNIAKIEPQEQTPAPVMSETTALISRKRRSPISAEMARQIIDYDPATGSMAWRVRRPDMFKENADPRHSPSRTCATWNTRFAGTTAGKKNKDGYLVLCVFYQNVMAHRLAWLIMTGEWPSDEIDHIDGCKSNNAFSNLRAASRGQNMCNRGMQSNNKTGFKGVRLNKRSGTFYAQITVDRKPKFLGSFSTPEEAHVAYRNAAETSHGNFSNAGDQS